MCSKITFFDERRQFEHSSFKSEKKTKKLPTSRWEVFVKLNCELSLKKICRCFALNVSF